jgi:hypothetical protein
LVELYQELENLENSVTAREALEVEFAACEARQRTFDLLFRGLGLLRDRWTVEVSEFPKTQAQLIGNSLVLSASVMYFGCFGNAERVELFEELLGAMKKESIARSPGNRQHYIAEYFGRFVDRDFVTRDLFRTRSSQLEVLAITARPKAALAIDLEGFVLQFPSLSTPLEKRIIWSMHSASARQIISRALQEGLLILVDVLWLHPLVEAVLSYSVK